ncbi:MAG: caspase domain-containing protein, partial [Spirochaetia bacterium]
YAASDAKKMADVLSDIGGMSERNMLLLIDPTVEEIRKSIQSVNERMSHTRSDSRRSEFFIYYSGHSDEYGLLIGEETYTYKELRNDIETVDADVNVAVLDSCASGAFTRLKGGIRYKPFLVDDSSDMEGHAFLTSSSENEASQESDRIEASFFTHFLISGLRGAADSTKDGKITLMEVYQFAHAETLASTEGSMAGPQHPSYEINLNGTGDLVITEITNMSAGMIVNADVEGRLFIRNTEGKLIAELRKTAGIPITVALSPGNYSVILTNANRTFESSIVLRVGDKAEIGADDFSITVREVNTVRGNTEVKKEPLPGTGKTSVNAALKKPERRLLNVTLLPGISLSGISGTPVTEDTLSLGVVFAHSYQLRGLMISNVIGMVDTPSVGVMSAGAANIADTGFTGYQNAGVFNTVTGTLYGVQTAGVFNSTGRDMTGFQAAGVFNTAGGEVTGCQVSGLYSSAGSIRGVQLSPVNLSGDVRGAQVGMVNIAKEVRGVQVGLINIADDVYGLPIGLFSWVRNGIHDAVFWFEGKNRVWAAFQSGTKTLYSIFYAGVNRDGDYTDVEGLAFGAGGGIRWKPSFFYFDADVSAKVALSAPASFMTGYHNIFPSVRVTAGGSFGGGLGFFVGGTFDIVPHTPNLKTPEFFNGSTNFELFGNDYGVRIYPIFFTGFKI